ncbi:hypothetical protein C6H68_24750 [Photorhabdus luminescens]|nr:hypothetical protein C6H68_24750 [Photorhabdus luminescens]
MSEAEIDSFQQAVSQKTQPRLLLKKMSGVSVNIACYCQHSVAGIRGTAATSSVSRISVIDAKWIIPAFA